MRAIFSTDIKPLRGKNQNFSLLILLMDLLTTIFFNQAPKLNLIVYYIDTGVRRMLHSVIKILGYLTYFSKSAIFLSLLICRSLPENFEVKKACTNSFADSTPVVLPPRQMRFILSSSTPWCAEK